MEHVGVLGDVADRVLQRLQGDVADVLAADAHGAGRGVVQAGDEVGDGRLAGAGRADQGDHLAGLGGEGDAAEDLAVVAGLDPGDLLQGRQRHLVGARVGEGDVVELEPRGGAGQHDGAGLLGDQRRQVEHLEDALEAHQGRHHVDAHVGEALQRAEQAQQQGGEGEQGADGQRAAQREVAADAVDQRGGERRDEHHRGAEDAGDERDPHARGRARRPPCGRRRRPPRRGGRRA